MMGFIDELGVELRKFGFGRSIKDLKESLPAKGGYVDSKVGCLLELKTMLNAMVTKRQTNVSACTGFANVPFTDKMSIKNMEVFRDTQLGNFCDARCACDTRTPCSCVGYTCGCVSRCSCDARCSCDSRTLDYYCNCQVRVGVAGCTCHRVSVPSCNCVSRNICSCNAVTVACNCNARTNASAACNCQSRTAGICPCVNVQGDVAYICSCNTRASCSCNPYAGEPVCLCNIRTTG